MSDPDDKSAVSVRMHFGPGEFWTGERRYTCDGIVVSLVPSEDEQRFASATVEQLHDINAAPHRTRSETREHLRRCLRLILKEGLLLDYDGKLRRVLASDVSASPKLSLQVYSRPNDGTGPFTAITDADLG